jgi:hypothetical protein
VYNELSTAVALLKDPNEKGASAFVPFRRIERSPSLKVAVTYDGLTVLVRDPRIARCQVHLGKVRAGAAAGCAG